MVEMMHKTHYIFISPPHAVFPECSKQLSHLHEELCYVSYLNFTYNLCRIILEGLCYVSHLNSTYTTCVGSYTKDYAMSAT